MGLCSLQSTLTTIELQTFYAHTDINMEMSKWVLKKKHQDKKGLKRTEISSENNVVGEVSYSLMAVLLHQLSLSPTEKYEGLCLSIQAGY